MKRNDSVFDPAELAALYAAGVLPPEEAAAVESRLDAGESLLAGELSSYEAVILALAEEAEPVAPDPEIRQRLLQKAERPGSVEERRPSRSDQEPGPRPEIFIWRTELERWRDLDIPGVQECVIHHDRLRNVQTKLIRMAPGSVLPAHWHPGLEECYVLEGDIRSFGRSLGSGTFMRAPSGTHHSPSSTENGCLLLLRIAPDATPPA